MTAPMLFYLALLIRAHRPADALLAELEDLLDGYWPEASA